jgi:hypothetical protein
MEKQVLNRRKDVELFEAIRREYQFGVGTVKGVARKFGVHRRMVREALGDAIPKQRKIVERVRPKLEPAVAFIDGIRSRRTVESRRLVFQMQGTLGAESNAAQP